MVHDCAQSKTKANIALVKLMLDSGCCVNERDSKGRTPLHTAVNAGTDNPDESLDLEALLMKHGANANLLDDRMRTQITKERIDQTDQFIAD